MLHIMPKYFFTVNYEIEEKPNMFPWFLKSPPSFALPASTPTPSTSPASPASPALGARSRASSCSSRIRLFPLLTFLFLWHLGSLLTAGQSSTLETSTVASKSESESRSEPTVAVGQTEKCQRSSSIFSTDKGLEKLVALLFNGTDWCEKGRNSKDCPAKDTPPATVDSVQGEGDNSTNATKQEPGDEAINTPPLERLPVNISVLFYIEDINSINEVDMDYRLDYYMQQEWKTSVSYCKRYINRLVQKGILKEQVEHKEGLRLTPSYFSLFWIPDTFVTNAKDMDMQSKVLKTQSLDIKAENITEGNDLVCSMKYTVRYQGTIACDMNFHRYPVDTQICNITMRSFAYDEKAVVLTWNNLTINSKLVLLEHELTQFKEKQSLTIFKRNYTALKITLKMKRNIANKLAGVFTPSLLIVIITFTTFWLGPSSISDRVTIGVTALLAVVQQFSQARGSLPPISYISEIDKWMLLCMLFVAIQLVQATVLHFLYERKKHEAEKRERFIRAAHYVRGQLATARQQRAPLQLGLHPVKADDGRNQRSTSGPVLLGLMDATKFGGGTGGGGEGEGEGEGGGGRGRGGLEMRAKMEAQHQPRHGLLGDQLKQNLSLANEKGVQEKERPEESVGLADCCGPCFRIFRVSAPPESPEHLPMKIDAYSRLLIPLAFSLCCAYYWPSLLLTPEQK